VAKPAAKDEQGSEHQGEDEYMALSIGIDYNRGHGKTCLMENGQVTELHSFMDAAALLAYLEHTCALYPEPVVALASASDESLPSLQEDTNSFLIAIDSINLKNHRIPAVEHLPTIPTHRKLKQAALGTPAKLCTVAALLHHMREQEALWSEMNFLYLEVGENARTIIVAEGGRIVNGIGGRVCAGMDNRESQKQCYLNGSSKDTPPYAGEHIENALCNREPTQALELAFWERLTQDLAGLMAIHHFEDIVVAGQSSLKNAVIDRFGDTYQFYLYPQSEPHQEGFETAIGAALIAEGLYYPGLAGEVVERLQIREVSVPFSSTSPYGGATAPTL